MTVDVARQRRVALLLAVLAVGACESAQDPPLLTDPHEIVTAAAASTAALGTVHAQIDLTATNGGRAEDLIRFRMETDIDAQGRNVAGRVQMTQGDPPARAPETSEFVILDQAIFSRNGDAPSWFMSNRGGDELPTTAAYLGLIERAIGNGSAVLALADERSCGPSTCYHVSAALDPEASWLLLVAPLIGRPADPAVAPPADMVPTPATLELYVDQKTRRLAGVEGTFSIQGTAVSFSVIFSNHDVPILITAPPPHLIDAPNQGGGGVGPAETPALSVGPVETPAESVGP